LARKHESQRITLIGGALLAALTLVAGIAVYAVMQRQLESVLVNSLQSSLHSDRRLFDSEIRGGVINALTVSTRPFVIDNLTQLIEMPDDKSAADALQRVADSFLPTGFSGIAFYDPQGNEIARAGSLAEQPALQVPLNLKDDPLLLWDDGIVLRLDRDVLDARGAHVGSARAEAVMPQLTRAIVDAAVHGRTAELAVCAPRDPTLMQCFPLTVSNVVLPELPLQFDGKPLPMSLALEGKTGVVMTQDYRREEVVATYTPIGDLGLGMVLKVDRAELFEPIRTLLGVIVPLLGGLILLGMFLLYWLVSPLVRRLVESQQQTAEANARLRDVEERWRFALDSTGAGVWDLDLLAGKMLLSARCKRMFGYEDSEIGTSVDEWQALVHRDDAPALAAACQQLLDGEVQSFTNEHRKHCKDGSWKWVQARGMVAARDQNDTPIRLIGTYIDISERKQAEEIIQQQANFDPLTKLPNRRLFLDRLGQQVAKSQRTGSSLALLLIDLDEFKEVNDTLGHDVGDILLQEAARRIRGCIRDTDTVARLGGDEFTVLLGDLTGRAHVEEIAQKLIARVAEPYYLREGVTHVSASIGITLYPGDAEDVDELMKHADQAMYEAKKQGRNRFCYFTHSLQEAAQQRFRLSRELRQGVEAGQFEAHFQPIVELATGRIQKAEALLRWRHPERGLVAPAQFIPLAEETGLIEGMGDWVFRESVRRARAWRERFGSDLQVSVNMSPVQFRGEGRERVEAWLGLLEDSGVSGEQIVIEITESLLLDAHDEVTAQLFRLRDAGIQIAIDDFGTGYCTLSYLKQFPINYLKIDRSFVSNLESDPNDLALSKAIIVMAHELGLKVIAEGVETEGQSHILAAAGCDYAQGHFYARALPANVFEDLLCKKGRMLTS